MFVCLYNLKYVNFRHIDDLNNSFMVSKSLYTGYLIMSTLTNSEHDLFSRLHSLGRQNGSPEKEIQYYLEGVTCHPSVHTLDISKLLY